MLNEWKCKDCDQVFIDTPVKGELMEHGMNIETGLECGSTNVEFIGKWIMILDAKDQRLADEIMKGPIPNE